MYIKFSVRIKIKNWLKKILGLGSITKEKRIYIRVEFRQSLGMNFVSPFQPGCSKCTNHVNIKKIYAVE